jgi:hypothetical protein
MDKLKYYNLRFCFKANYESYILGKMVMSMVRR